MAFQGEALKFVRAPVPDGTGAGSSPQSLDTTSTTPPERKKSKIAERIMPIHQPAIIPEGDHNFHLPDYAPTEFEGKRVLITGVSHFDGFGYEAAKQLVEHGAIVAFSYRERTEEVDQIEGDLKKRAAETGGQVVGLKADFKNPYEAATLVSRAVRSMRQPGDEQGRLDIYVANAATIQTGVIHKQTIDEVTRDVTINVTSPQIVLGEAAAQMAENRGGRIVPILSVGADGAPDQSRYGGSKAYMFGSARGAAMDSILHHRGRITYVSIAPGLAPTHMTKDVVANDGVSNMAMDVAGQSEMLSASQVADYIVFASSSHVPTEMNGQVIKAVRPLTPAPTTK